MGARRSTGSRGRSGVADVAMWQYDTAARARRGYWHAVNVSVSRQVLLKYSAEGTRESLSCSLLVFGFLVDC